MWLKYEPHDPENQLIDSFHSYNWTACASVSCWNKDVAPLAKVVPVVTGEFGESDCRTAFIKSFMNWADAHNVSYLALNWQTPDQASRNRCVAASPHNRNDIGTNLMLLSNWNGAPSSSAPEGAVIKAHMEMAHDKMERRN